MNKINNFKDYLKHLSKENGLPSRYLVKDLLKTLKFKIIGNSNSHNYSDFLNDDNELIFNNITGYGFTGETIEEGCVNDDSIGNSIRLTDLMPILDLNKLDILKNIENIDKKITNLKKSKQVQLSKLEYLTETNKKSVDDSTFDEFIKSKITGIKNTEIIEEENLEEV